jgi:hypothetical protein
MRPVTLWDEVDADVITSTPGTYVAADTSPAYGQLIALTMVGDAEMIGYTTMEDGHHAVMIRVGARENPREFSGVISLDSDYFMRAIEDYAQWELKWWRETIQNSIDNGATEVSCSMTFLDENRNEIEWEDFNNRRFASVSIVDNGSGMTEDILINKFIKPGRTTKLGVAGAVGGFGKAKELILLAHPEWVVETTVAGASEKIVLRGEGTQWSGTTEPSNGKHGTRITVLMPADRCTNIGNARNYIERCYLPKVKFTVQGEEQAADTAPGELVHEIPGKAKIYKAKSNLPYIPYGVIWTRINGLYMYDQPAPQGVNDILLIELLGPSTQVLVSNREKISDVDLRNKIYDWTNRLAADVRSAMTIDKKVTPPLIYPANVSADEVQVQRANVLYNMGDMSTNDKNLLSAEQSASIMAQFSEWTAGKKIGTKKAFDARPLKETVKASASLPYFGSFDVERSILALTTPCKYVVAYYGDDKGDFQADHPLRLENLSVENATLLRLWTELCRIVLVQLTFPQHFDTGFVISDNAAALHTKTANFDALLINPQNFQNYTRIWNLNSEKDLRQIWSLVIHEATHFVNGLSFHNEVYTSALTDNIARTAFAEREIKNIWRACLGKTTAIAAKKIAIKKKTHFVCESLSRDRDREKKIADFVHDTWQYYESSRSLRLQGAEGLISVALDWMHNIVQDDRIKNDAASEEIAVEVNHFRNVVNLEIASDSWNSNEVGKARRHFADISPSTNKAKFLWNVIDTLSKYISLLGADAIGDDEYRVRAFHTSQVVRSILNLPCQHAGDAYFVRACEAIAAPAIKMFVFDGYVIDIVNVARRVQDPKSDLRLTALSIIGMVRYALKQATNFARNNWAKNSTSPFVISMIDLADEYGHNLVSMMNHINSYEDYPATGVNKIDWNQGTSMMDYSVTNFLEALRRTHTMLTMGAMPTDRTNAGERFIDELTYSCYGILRELAFATWDTFNDKTGFPIHLYEMFAEIADKQLARGVITKEEEKKLWQRIRNNLGVQSSIDSYFGHLGFYVHDPSGAFLKWPTSNASPIDIDRLINIQGSR